MSKFKVLSSMGVDKTRFCNVQEVMTALEPSDTKIRTAVLCETLVDGERVWWDVIDALSGKGAFAIEEQKHQRKCLTQVEIYNLLRSWSKEDSSTIPLFIHQASVHRPISVKTHMNRFKCTVITIEKQ